MLVRAALEMVGTLRGLGVCGGSVLFRGLMDMAIGHRDIKRVLVFNTDTL
jgi:hypothetical protein